jgi:hypothetical protein
MLQKAGIFDTHPSPLERIRQAEDEETEGVFKLEHPARRLFRNFEDLCKRGTLDYYIEQWGPRARRMQLLSTRDLTQRQTFVRESQHALIRFFHGYFSGFRPITIPPVGLEMYGRRPNVEAVVRELNNVRGRIENSGSRINEALERYAQTDMEHTLAVMATALIQAEVHIHPADYNLDKGTLDGARSARRNAQERKRLLVQELKSYEEDLKLRLKLSLSLLHDPEIASKIQEGATLARRADALMRPLSALGGVAPALFEMQRHHNALRVLLEQAQKHRGNQALREEIGRRAEKIWDLMNEVNGELSYEKYPFRHGRGGVRLAEFAVEKMPKPGDIDGIYQQVDGMLERLFDFYQQALGLLALMAEQAEIAIGLEPLKILVPTEEGSREFILDEGGEGL